MANYLNVPSGGGASTPHQAGLTVGANALDTRVQVAATTWASGTQMLINQYNDGTADDRWYFRLDGTGAMIADFVNAAGTHQNSGASSTVPALGIADGSRVWLREVIDATAGSISHYWGTDGVGWTLINQNTSLTTTGMRSSGTPPVLAIGQTSAFADNLFVGKIYRTQVIVGGVTIIDMDWTTAALGNGTWTATTGEVWTRFGTSSVLAEPVTSRQLALTGVGA